MATLEPVGPDFYDTAPWKIDIVREVVAPRADVWSMVSVNENWKLWFPGCKECRTTSDQPSGVGSARSFVGAGTDVRERFIVWDEERVWGHTITEMKFAFARRMAERIELTDVSGGRTRIAFRMAVDPKPWARWMRPFIAFGGQRTVGKGLENIERVLRR